MGAVGGTLEGAVVWPVAAGVALLSGAVQPLGNGTLVADVLVLVFLVLPMPKASGWSQSMVRVDKANAPKTPRIKRR